jgi:hypothetical protein
MKLDMIFFFFFDKEKLDEIRHDLDSINLDNHLTSHFKKQLSSENLSDVFYTNYPINKVTGP